jgi:hypothetical protein
VREESGSKGVKKRNLEGTNYEKKNRYKYIFLTFSENIYNYRDIFEKISDQESDAPFPVIS